MSRTRPPAVRGESGTPAASTGPGAHDRAVQRLLGISYQLASVQHYTDRSADSLTPAVAEIRAEVLEVSRQLRALIGQLRPAGLDEMGLVVALEGYVAQVQRGPPRARQ
ncbi:MAG: hypothetical protein HZY76_11865 [Anaerolineae bacterium]|nr:MAG: hypothetical protein HZY76_11865 [Anaerolineae bacterium]